MGLRLLHCSCPQVQKIDEIPQAFAGETIAANLCNLGTRQITSGPVVGRVAGATDRLGAPPPRLLRVQVRHLPWNPNLHTDRVAFSVFRFPHPQQPLQSLAARRVFQRQLMPRQPLGRGEGGQRRFVKAAQDQLALAGVGNGVAYGVDAGHAGGEGGRVDYELFAL